MTIALILASCSSNTEEAVVNEAVSESIPEESNNETAADNLFYQVPLQEHLNFLNKFYLKTLLKLSTN